MTNDDRPAADLAEASKQKHAQLNEEVVTKVARTAETLQVAIAQRWDALIQATENGAALLKKPPPAIKETNAHIAENILFSLATEATKRGMSSEDFDAAV